MGKTRACASETRSDLVTLTTDDIASVAGNELRLIAKNEFPRRLAGSAASAWLLRLVGEEWRAGVGARPRLRCARKTFAVDDGLAVMGQRDEPAVLDRPHDGQEVLLGLPHRVG